MKKKKLNKDIKKSIIHSWGRFISIILLMALGSFALVGLTVTGPDMRETAIDYFEELNAADITIISDYGISETEQEYIEQASNIKEIEYVYFQDVTIEDTYESIRIFSKPNSISLYEVVDGRLPENDTEIAILSTYSESYNIGDTISFTEKIDENESETLKIHEFEIVGFINSAEMLSSINLGQTTTGTGELNGYAVVNENIFDSEVYMMAKLIFTDTEDLSPYSDEYNDIIQTHKEELENLLSQTQDIRFSNIKSEYQTEINEGWNEVNEAKQELEDAREELANAKLQIEDAQKEIEESENTLLEAKSQIEEAELEIEENEQTLADSEEEYNSNLAEYNQNLAELNSAKEEIDEAQNEIDSQSETLENAKYQYEYAISVLQETVNEYELALQSSSLSDEQIISITAQITSYQTQLEQIQAEYEYFITYTYNTGIETLKQAQETLNVKIEEYNTAKSQLESAKNELDSAKQQIEQGKTSLENVKVSLSNSKQEYNDGLQQLEEAKLELEEKETEYNEALEEFEKEEKEALEEIEEAEQELEDAQKELDKLSIPTYSVYNRRETLGGEGYSTYETVAEIIDSLAKVFPIFLYFVAALVTFTTMTRFVGDERINSGTLKSLGYNDRDVIKKFVIYGFIAGMIGTIIGVILGHTLIPIIVYKAYSGGFTLPEIELHFYPLVTIVAVLLSLLSSVVPAIIVAKKELQENTASLLQPKTPKAGTKILLEKITPIWNKMSFTHKVTARNIFRYKNRMFMTIFGVAGASAILFTGFSVKYSISEINDRQFGDIIKYSAIVALNDDLTDEEEIELQDLLNSEEVNSYTSVYYEEVTKKAGDNNDTQSIKLIVPETTEDFNSYISLINRKNGENIDLTNDGVIISERLADLLEVDIGDSFSYIDSNSKERTVIVSGICEMYAGHFMFMNITEYENVYGETVENNARLLLFNDTSIENVNTQSAKFMELSSVEGIVQNTTLYNQINTIVNSLNKIMLVLIVVSVLLTIVILYNLTNINVEERIRELCTIKVLGFYDNETTMYIYRETIILSIIGVIIGWILGALLHTYILNVVPPDEVMFNPAVWIGAFIIPLVTVSVVTIILKFYVNHKLKNVDMLEALKSVD